MRQTIEQQARSASGRERYCGKCKFRMPNQICSHIDVCHNAFVRGYIKGYKYGKQENKQLAATNNAESKLSFITELLDERQLEKYVNWLKTIE